MRVPHFLTTVGVAIASVAIGATLGCRAEPAQAPSGPPLPTMTAPPEDAAITIHFTRPALGVADKQPISISSSNHNGANLTLSGRFVRLDDDWLVVKQNNREQQWIARENILYISVSAP